ncbi:hypothetical protein SmJEL517_g03957 [Synchytrium microbalum]|uniref:Peptide hydrolase n=1 Tax=Synchytrium microbalum TaxID=1806994 RepID=A0A507C567_9FUNG|nr:uncharacterized protein SmJEL517_g03957 [Synchytrium microbalum]TPX33126.1 hypothetical protein SmJEL517_g03957 [Synchytrium microbalum]
MAKDLNGSSDKQALPRNDTPRKSSSRRKPSTSNPYQTFWPSVTLVFVVSIVIALYRYNALPTPLDSPYDDAGRPQFSEGLARKIVSGLADEIGLRLTGSLGEKQAEDLILGKLDEYKQASIQAGGVPVFEISVQRARGSHEFYILQSPVLKIYENITNIVVRLSCGSECNKNAVLLNSHFDTTLLTPGATDDAAGVAIMLETIRVLALSKTPMKNAAIFVFNGAEETLQDGSTAFIRQHELKDTIRSIINIEACGSTGKAVVFQTNSPDLMKVYAKTVPYPSGTVLANDVFKTGIIGSDTDFKQFVAYGGLPGIDQAYIRNSYVYHTMLDVEEAIERGSLQQLGENTLKLVEAITTSVDDLADWKQSYDIIFYDLLGYVEIVYDSSTGLRLMIIIVSLSLLQIVRDVNRERNSSGDNAVVARYLVAYLSCLVSFVASLVGPALTGLYMQTNSVPMRWFTREWYAIILFFPSGILGLLLVQAGTRRIYQYLSPGLAYEKMERATLTGLLAFMSTLFVLFTCLGLGSAFVSMIYTATLWLGLVVENVFREPKGLVPPGIYHIILPLPVMATTTFVAGLLDMLIPLMGRIGASAPTDLVTGALSGTLVFWMGYMVLPAFQRLSSYSQWNAIRLIAVSSLVMPVIFQLFVSPYDNAHPKRIWVEYKNNATSGEQSLLVAHADNAMMPSVLATIEKVVKSKPVLRSPEVSDYDWAALFPFSHFIESYHFTLPPAPAGASDNPAPEIRVLKSVYNESKNERSVVLHAFHPNHVWTVMSFYAEVLEWSLDSQPEDHPSVYVVKNAGGYITNGWTVNMTVRGSAKIPVELTGLERDSMHGLGRFEGEHSKRAGRSWLWSDNYRSARVLKDVERAISDLEYVNGAFISVDVVKINV